MYDIERIYQAAGVADAIAALKADPEAVVISGGSDVLIKVREGRLAGCSLVSIHGIDELEGIMMEPDGTIVIRPGTTFADVAGDPLVRQHLPALGFAVEQAGGPQLRNVGTIGGNICNGATSADSAPTLLTLNAMLEITGSEGLRYMELERFYRGPGKVELSHGELLTAIRIAKKDYEGFGGHYIKYAMRNAMDIATLGCAAHVRVSGGNIEELRLAFGVAAPTPVRCRKTEAAVSGKPVTRELFGEIGEMALTELCPRTSWRASKEFRERLVRELTGRVLRQAIMNQNPTVSREVMEMIKPDPQQAAEYDSPGGGAGGELGQ